jgi:hypothetical protein
MCSTKYCVALLNKDVSLFQVFALTQGEFVFYSNGSLSLPYFRLQGIFLLGTSIND